MSKEKDIALKVALQVGQYIQENMPEVEVIYTRKTDTFIELKERSNIANRNKADLFISIHCNAAPSRAAYGTETFVMGTKNFEANFDIVKRENSVILLEENFEEQYEGFDPSSPESYMMFNLMQKAFLSTVFPLLPKLRRISVPVSTGIREGLNRHRYTYFGRQVCQASLSNWAFFPMPMRKNTSTPKTDRPTYPRRFIGQ
jgi:N-acetylmuramoyl-L-alanine amidase